MAEQSSEKSARFGLGTIVATPGVLELVSEFELRRALVRHARGDWGVVDPHDRGQNDLALKTGLRLLSVYESDRGKFWIITEADRSSTTVLLPSEY